VNDGPVLERSLEDLYRMGDAVLSVAIVPVGLTAFSDHAASRQPTRDECRAAVDIVRKFSRRALAERGIRWAHGSDELYLVAGLELPPVEEYEGFEQVENGVGSVRFLQERIREAGDAIPELHGKRVAVLTGTAMGRLMPEVLRTLADRTGGAFELTVLENDLFGPSVTTAALLPGKAFQRALATLEGVDLALLPAEAVNDDGIFIDDVPFHELAAAAPMEVRLSHHFTDALPQAAAV
jgi:NifB/MoaA-like Fe-S oxidoreductase